MQKKLWGGRFDKSMAPEVERFTASVHLDRRLFEHDIRGSLAHVKMLARCGLISRGEQRKLSAGLKRVGEEIRNGRFRPSARHEDIHMAIETRLKKLVGPVADKLHTARSRNDQVALDLRLFLREEIGAVTDLIRRLQRELVRTALRNRKLVMPGFTHLQHGQPVLLAHHLLAYVEMLERDAGRLGDCLVRVNVMPLGSCALAGTALPIDRRYAAGILGFGKVSENSIDAVSDRDFICEFLSAAAIVGMHLSRLAEEVVLWASREFSFLEIDLSYCSGSSMMPQKANPDVAELVRARSGGILGSLVTMHTVLKGLPLAYNRDMQEDKKPLFDAVDTLKGCLTITAGLWKKIRFRPGALRDAMRRDFSQATDLAEYLVLRGCPFRQAHAAVGKLVAHCMREGKGLEDLTLETMRSFSALFERDALGVLSHETSVGLKKSEGSTAPGQVAGALRKWKRRLGMGHA